MMAFDRTPSLPTLEPETIDALRASFRSSLATGSPAPDLRDLLCPAARQAREKGIPAERLLITLKDVWHTILATDEPPPSTDGTALLQQLISRCIQEYYAL